MAATELTKGRLIRTALELFTTRGYHDTTTAQIAKKAGIAEGTIYRHFASKQQLVNELYRAAQRWATKVVQETQHGPALLDDESRRTAREFRVALERIVAESKAQGAVRTGAVEIWAGVWMATMRHALEKVVAGEWKAADTGVRLVIEAAWKAISA